MLMGVGSCTGDIECTNCDLRLKKDSYFVNTHTRMYIFKKNMLLYKI